MKAVYPLLATSLVSIMVGCASPKVAVAPVGPNPERIVVANAPGRLQVFSSLVGRAEGDNPTWHQHSDYFLYDSTGNLVKRVRNTIGYYATAPRSVRLPAGNYVVKAQATDYSWVNVPVSIRDGETTRVHLDDNWNVPATTPSGTVVWLPDGKPVGWRAQPGDSLSVN